MGSWIILAVVLVATTGAAALTCWRAVRRSASDVATAARKLREAQEGRETAETLLKIQHDLIAQVCGASNPQQALNRMAECLCSIPGVVSTGIYLMQPSGDLDLAATCRADPALLAVLSHLDADSPRARRVRAARRSYQLSIPEDPAPCSDLIAAKGIRSAFIVPLRRGEECLGCLVIGTDQPSSFSSPTLALVETTAETLSSVIGRLRMENMLRLERENLANLFDAATDLVFVLDESGSILEVNRAAAEALGYGREELRQMRVEDLHAAGGAGEVAEARSALASDQRNRCVIPLRRRDGSSMTVETVVFRGFWDRRPVLVAVSRDVSERERVMRALADSERRYRELVENLQDVILAVDAKGVIHYVSPVVQEMLGYHPAELAGTSFLSWVHESDAGTVKGCLSAACHDQRITISFRMHKRDGTLIWARMSLRASEGEAGKVGLWHGVLRDVTERTLAEMALRESEETFRSVVESSLAGIVILDEHGRPRYANRRALEMCGRLGCEIEKTTVQDWVCPEDYPHLRQRIVDRLAGKPVPSVYETRLRRQDGSVFPVEVSAVRIRWKGQWNDLAFLHDISMRKAAEEALRTSEENFRRLAESAFDGILIVSAEGRHLFANQRASELSGYSIEEILGTTAADWVVPEELPRVRQFITARIAGRPAPSVYETRIRRKDGSVIPVEVSAGRTLWQGEPCSVVMLRDITPRKRMEEEILRIRDWERARIGRDLHDGVSQQLAGVAYLSQSLAASLEAGGEAKWAEAASHIAEECRRALDEMRRVIRGLNPVPQTPHGLYQALVNLAATTREMFGVACVLQTDGQATISDHEVAMQVFHMAQEAVTNAVKHGRARNIVIRLAVRNGSGELQVEDDGTGLSADSGGPAQGMGLRIMRYRADLIGGALCIESPPTGGVRVVCRFPIPAADRGACDTQSAVC